MEELRQTPLHRFHLDHGARMVDFAGYDMPVRYEAGPVAEHQRARTAAALFDVSHMGIVELRGDAVADSLEAVVPSAIRGLGEQRMRYTFLTNDAGGILDDLMVTNHGGHLTAVLNAGRKEADLAHLETHLEGVELTHRTDLALLALQGPDAVAVMGRLDESVLDLAFLDAGDAVLDGVPVAISRSGYTGEDGVEITVAASDAVTLAERLLHEPEVALAGLAARDSLRLEAGLCLYGHDIDETTTPIEAGLAWAIQKRRREEGGFPGAEVILRQLADGPPRHRVGIAADGRKPIREGSALHDEDGTAVGAVTSGGFGPTVDRPVAMGYVAAGHHHAGTALHADVRGKAVACHVAELPFTPHRYVRRTR